MVHGSCVEVTCGLPPEARKAFVETKLSPHGSPWQDVPHAHAVLDPSHSNISTGAGFLLHAESKRAIRDEKAWSFATSVTRPGKARPQA